MLVPSRWTRSSPPGREAPEPADAQRRRLEPVHPAAPAVGPPLFWVDLAYPSSGLGSPFAQTSCPRSLDAELDQELSRRGRCWDPEPLILAASLQSKLANPCESCCLCPRRRRQTASLGCTLRWRIRGPAGPCPGTRTSCQSKPGPAHRDCHSRRHRPKMEGRRMACRPCPCRHQVASPQRFWRRSSSPMERMAARRLHQNHPWASIGRRGKAFDSACDLEPLHRPEYEEGALWPTAAQLPPLRHDGSRKSCCSRPQPYQTKEGRPSPWTVEASAAADQVRLHGCRPRQGGCWKPAPRCSLRLASSS